MYQLGCINPRQDSVSEEKRNTNGENVSGPEISTDKQYVSNKIRPPNGLNVS